MDDAYALTLALWLANLKANAIHLGRNDEHACNYMFATQWIEEHPEDFKHCAPEEIKRMEETDTIWSLQIYPATPVGFVRWVAPTMLGVIAKARNDWPDVLASYPSLREDCSEGK